MQKYLLAIDAKIVWAKVKPLAYKAIYGEGEVTESGAKVAAELETWFYYYKQEWRRVSQEGDLGKISSVVYWYADLIRKLG